MKYTLMGMFTQGNIKIIILKEKEDTIGNRAHIIKEVLERVSDVGQDFGKLVKKMDSKIYKMMKFQGRSIILVNLIIMRGVDMEYNIKRMEISTKAIFLKI